MISWSSYSDSIFVIFIMSVFMIIVYFFDHIIRDNYDQMICSIKKGFLMFGLFLSIYILMTVVPNYYLNQNSTEIVRKNISTYTVANIITEEEYDTKRKIIHNDITYRYDYENNIYLGKGEIDHASISSYYTIDKSTFWIFEKYTINVYLGTNYPYEIIDLGYVEY